MIGGKALIESMSSSGYKHVRGTRFEAEFSTDDVKHFLELTPNRVRTRVALRFELSNPTVEKFSTYALSTLVGGHYRERAKVSRKNLNAIGFELLEENSKQPLDIYVLDVSEEQIANAVMEETTKRIVPLVSSTRTKVDLYEFLLSNSDQTSWIRTNGAIRSAYIAALGKWSGKVDSEIMERLKPYMFFIELIRVPDAATFIKDCIYLWSKYSYNESSCR